jgi:hypothetical protein
MQTIYSERIERQIKLEISEDDDFVGEGSVSPR